MSPQMAQAHADGRTSGNWRLSLLPVIDTFPGKSTGMWQGLCRRPPSSTLFSHGICSTDLAFRPQGLVTQCGRIPQEANPAIAFWMSLAGMLVCATNAFTHAAMIWSETTLPRSPARRDSRRKLNKRCLSRVRPKRAANMPRAVSGHYIAQTSTLSPRALKSVSTCESIRLTLTNPLGENFSEKNTRSAAPMVNMATISTDWTKE